jgi:hypothetical protein
VAKFDLAELAAPALARGEEILATVRVNWNGMVPPAQVSTGAGLSALGQTLGPPTPDQLVAFPSAKQMALVLTGGRILAWSLGLTGKPKQYLGEVPLTAIAEVQLDQVRFGGLIRIVMRSTAQIDLEVMRGEDGDGFFGQLRHLVESS